MMKVHGQRTLKFTTRSVKGKLRGNYAVVMMKKQKTFKKKSDKTNVNEKDKYKRYADKHNMAFFVCAEDRNTLHKSAITKTSFEQQI